MTVKKIRIFAINADPEKDKHSFSTTKKLFENGIAKGLYERIDRRTGRYTSAIYESSPVSSSLADLPIPELLCSGVCEICSFNRLIERAHIVPARFGGPKIPENILHLCPNHHTLYDRNLLTHEEFCKIWPKVCVALQGEYSGSEFEEWRRALSNRHGVSVQSS